MRCLEIVVNLAKPFDGASVSFHKQCETKKKKRKSREYVIKCQCHETILKVMNQIDMNDEGKGIEVRFIFLKISEPKHCVLF